jgi:diguanylate cyclase (GGDEF)-like protein
MSDREARLQAGIAAIWQKSLPRVREQLDLLERAAVALLEGPLDSALRREAEREAHKLAGAAGVFGFRESSEIARELELMLTAGATPDARRAAEIVVALRKQLDREELVSAPPVEAAGEVSDSVADVLIVAGDDAFAGAVVNALKPLGLPARISNTIDAAQQEIGSRVPALVLLDLSVKAEHGGDLLDRMRSQHATVPVIGVLPSGEFTDRVEAARRGVRSFLQMPMSAAEIASAINDTIQRATSETPRILAVDDDPNILSLLAATLRSAGFDVRGLVDPREFWSVIQEVRPDLLLLDYDMPYVNGLELCRVVRADARFHALPIIFITARTDSATVSQAFEAGADDFVGKPIIPLELLARVRGRIERVRLLKQLADTDYLTGLDNRRKSEDTLLDYQRLAERYKQPLSIALLDIDDLKRINEDFGYATGDEVLRGFAAQLRATFRGEDVIGRWGGEEFTIGMYGMHRDDAVHRLGEILETLQERTLGSSNGRTRVSFSGGVAEYGPDGRDLLGVIGQARANLAAAKQQGGARILGSPGKNEVSLDVLVVEDDETLAELLMHALQTRGYRAQRLSNGLSAADALSGDSAFLQPRVVLLDVDLPGMDGISVLRHWKEAGVLAHTRVIMLTVRSGEPEVLETLKLDAFDHVPKPFSTSVLMQRIRRALQP